jgi:hypothetical protein
MDVETLKGIAVVSLEERTFIVPFELTQSRGSDAFTIKSIEVAQKLETSDDVGTLSGLQDIEQLKIVDSEGTFLGILDVVEFDSECGLVTRSQAQKGRDLEVNGTTSLRDSASILILGTRPQTVPMDSGHMPPTE